MDQVVFNDFVKGQIDQYCQRNCCTTEGCTDWQCKKRQQEMGGICPVLHPDLFDKPYSLTMEWHKPSERPAHPCAVFVLSCYNGNLEIGLYHYDPYFNEYREISYEGLLAGIEALAWSYSPIFKIKDQANNQELSLEL